MNTKSMSFKILLMFLGLCYGINTANGMNPSDQILCLEKERHALLMFKQSLVDDSGRLSSWRSNDCCLWNGVGCNNRTGHVTILDLHNPSTFADDFEDYYNKKLRGKVNFSLLQLQHLRYLDLSGNDFEGSLFPNINGSLSKLTYLDLHDTSLSSINVYQLGNLSKLQFIDLSGNGYRISNLDWLHSLSSLRSLNLSYNSLSEAMDWPELFIKLPYLQDLKLSWCNLPAVTLSSLPLNDSTSLPISIDLSTNNLTSSVYPILFNISSKIVDLNLQYNLLEGSIPGFIKNMISLEHLDLSHNQLGDEIPEFLGNICTLKVLDLSDNYFSNYVPGLSGCIQNSLEILRLFMNHFQDSLILSRVTTFSSLRELQLLDNGLNGSFPTNFGQLSKLTMLDVSYNQLTGSLPDFTKLPSLKYLSIAYNKLNGTVPESLGTLSELEDLYASWNSLEGLICEAHFKNLSKLQTLDLSYNLLTFNVSSIWVPPFKLKQIYLSFCKLGPHFPKWLQTQKGFQDLLIFLVPEFRILSLIGFGTYLRTYLP